MGYSNDESSEEDSSESEESITSKSCGDDNDVDLEVEEFILPPIRLREYGIDLMNSMWDS